MRPFNAQVKDSPGTISPILPVAASPSAAPRSAQPGEPNHTGLPTTTIVSQSRIWVTGSSTKRSAASFSSAPKCSGERSTTIKPRNSGNRTGPKRRRHSSLPDPERAFRTTFATGHRVHGEPLGTVWTVLVGAHVGKSCIVEAKLNCIKQHRQQRMARSFARQVVKGQIFDPLINHFTALATPTTTRFA